MKSIIEDVGAKAKIKSKSRSPDKKDERSTREETSSPKVSSKKEPRKHSRSKSNSSSPSPIRSTKRKRSRSVSRSLSPYYSNRHSSSSRRDSSNNTCLGVFGMSLETTERTLEKEFERYGKLEKVKVIRDLGTGTSRGFAFVYFLNPKAAQSAREAMHGRKQIDGHTIRIDYSVGRRSRGVTHRDYERRPYCSPYYGRCNRRSDSEYCRHHGYDRRLRSRSPNRSRRSHHCRSRSKSYSPAFRR